MKNLDSVLSKFKALSEASVGVQDIRKEVSDVLNALKPVVQNDIKREVSRNVTIENIKTAFIDGGYSAPPKDMVEAFYSELSGPAKSAPKAPRAKKAEKPAVAKPAIAIQRPVVPPVVVEKPESKPFSFQ